MAEEAPDEGRTNKGGILWWIASSLVLVLLVVGGTVLAIRSTNVATTTTSGESTAEAPSVEVKANEKPSSKQPSTSSSTTGNTPTTAQPTATPTGLVVATPRQETPTRSQTTTRTPGTGLVVSNPNPVAVPNLPVIVAPSSVVATNGALAALAPTTAVNTPVIGPAVVTAPLPVAPLAPAAPVRPSAIVTARPTNIIPAPIFNPVAPSAISVPAFTAAPTVIVVPPSVVVTPPPVSVPTQTPTVVPTAIPTRGETATATPGPSVPTGPARDTAPTLPDAVRISNVSKTGGEVSWSAATDDKSISGYIVRVYRNNLPQAQFTVSGKTLGYTFTNWTAGTEYSVSITAIDNANQQSDERRSGSVTTESGTDAPPVMNGNPTQSSSTPNSISFTWPEGRDDYRVAYYRIFVDGNYVGRTQGTETSYTLNSASSGREYRIQVSAVDSGGNESARTDAVSMNTEDAPPSKPINPRAQEITTTSAVLTWSPATDDVGIAAYSIYRVSSLGQLTKIGTLDAATLTSDPIRYNISDLSPNRTYRYAISATDTAGQDSPRFGSDDVITFTTLAAQTVDTPPTAPGAIEIRAVARESVNFGWAPASDDNGVRSYSIYLDGVLKNVVSSATTSFSFAGLKTGVKYELGVQATDTKGQMGPIVKTTFMTTLDTPPTQPSGLVANPVTSTSAQLTWGASSDDIGVQEYAVLVDGTEVARTQPGQTAYSLRDLVKGTQYNVQVIAYDTIGQASTAAAVTFTTNDDRPPTAPLNVRVTSTGIESATLNWVAATDDIGIKRYDILVDGVKVMEAPKSALSALITGLKTGTEYTFTVVAVDTIEQKTESAPVQTTTGFDAIPEMVNPPIVRALDSTSALVEWQPGTDDKGITEYIVVINGQPTYKVPAATTQLVVPDLTPGQTYTFSIIAVDTVGQSSQNSPVSSVKLTARDMPPSTPGNLKAANITAGGATLTWDASTDDFGVDGYNVYVNGVLKGSTPATTLNYTLKGLMGERDYEISVAAIDSAGQKSTKFAAIALTTTKDLPPSPVQNPGMSDITTDSAKVNWQPAIDDIGVSKYSIYSGTQKVGDYAPSFTNVTLLDLMPGTTYTIRIIAYDTSGQASTAETLTFTTESSLLSGVTGLLRFSQPVPTTEEDPLTTSPFSGETQLPTAPDPERTIVAPTSTPAPAV